MIVPYHMAHNSEPEAVDLLLEVDAIAQLQPHVSKQNYERTCLYLTSTASYLPEPEDATVLVAAFDAYLKVEAWHDAMRVALRLNGRDKIEQVFAACTDGVHKQQLAYLLVRHGVMLDCEEGACAIDDADLREKVRVPLVSMFAVQLRMLWNATHGRAVCCATASAALRTKAELPAAASPACLVSGSCQLQHGVTAPCVHCQVVPSTSLQCHQSVLSWLFHSQVTPLRAPTRPIRNVAVAAGGCDPRK